MEKKDNADFNDGADDSLYIPISSMDTHLQSSRSITGDMYIGYITLKAIDAKMWIRPWRRRQKSYGWNTGLKERMISS
ncbi:MAG: hypothetical protein CM1200mP3_17230 [Chloroflexota bacterium]|nr:MAG: hypothetical protein CM1200mP3_17230 [Chloroflexota bacterium]